jgi:excisionase family DNA binding protein
MTTATLPRLLTAREVSEALGLPKWRVYQLAREEDLPSVRLGRSLRFDGDALAEWIQAGGTAAHGDEGR